MVKEMTDATFDTVIQSDKPVLVDFYATWCGPCKMLSPIVEELAEEHSEKVTFVQLDVDANPQTTATYGVMGMPTLLLFDKGQVVKQLVGYRPKSDLLNQLADVL